MSNILSQRGENISNLKNVSHGKENVQRKQDVQKDRMEQIMF